MAKEKLMTPEQIAEKLAALPEDRQARILQHFAQLQADARNFLGRLREVSEPDAVPDQLWMDGISVSRPAFLKLWDHLVRIADATSLIDLDEDFIPIQFFMVFDDWRMLQASINAIVNNLWLSREEWPEFEPSDP